MLLTSCWYNHICSQIVGAIQSILYATEDSTSVLAEAQAMIAQDQNQLPAFLSPIAEAAEEKPKQETQKRKDISTFEVDLVDSSKATPRQKFSDILNVLDDNPLMNFWRIFWAGSFTGRWLNLFIPFRYLFRTFSRFLFLCFLSHFNYVFRHASLWKFYIGTWGSWIEYNVASRVIVL